MSKDSRNLNMKILLYDETPAFLCHGGKQILAANLMDALHNLGVHADYARWWDDTQPVDIIHAFGWSPGFLDMAAGAEIPVVVTHIVDELSNSSLQRRLWHRSRNATIRALAPPALAKLLPWAGFHLIKAFTYLNLADLETAVTLYGVPRERAHSISHGCPDAQLAELQKGNHSSATYLLSIGTIAPRKNSVLLAKAAVEAKVPLIFVGSPFTQTDSYFRDFLDIVDGHFVRYLGRVTENDKVRLLQGASGFVSASRAESGCIAVHEAAAAGLDLLLPDLPWARSYGTSTTIRLIEPSLSGFARALPPFFATAKRATLPSFAVASWTNIAQQYLNVYRQALSH